MNTMNTDNYFYQSNESIYSYNMVDSGIYPSNYHEDVSLAQQPRKLSLDEMLFTNPSVSPSLGIEMANTSIGSNMGFNFQELLTPAVYTQEPIRPMTLPSNVFPPAIIYSQHLEQPAMNITKNNIEYSSASPVVKPLVKQPKPKKTAIEKQKPKGRGRQTLKESNDPSERPFPCCKPGCDKRFKRSEHLKRHVATVHKEGDRKPYTCPICQKRFSRKDNCKQHTLTHKPNKLTPTVQWTSSYPHMEPIQGFNTVEPFNVMPEFAIEQNTWFQNIPIPHFYYN